MTIRVAVSSDAAVIARLTAALGYAADEESVAGRLERLGRDRHQIVLVAVLDERVVGWLQAHAFDTVESGFRVEIVGLIVSEVVRRRGVGRVLVQHAEQWGRDLGAETMVVRSNTTRVGSHAFYPALGYSPSKTQAVYRKILKTEPNPSLDTHAPRRE